MRSKVQFPLNNWRRGHWELKDTDTWHQVRVLGAAWRAANDANKIAGEWGRYTSPSAPLPDIVLCVALYGYARQVIQELKQFPVVVPPEQVEEWREWGLGTSLYEFQDLIIAGAAGGFLQQAVKRPELTGEIITAQLEIRYQRLAELTNKPVEWFTPAEFTQEERDELEDWGDNDRLEEVFNVLEDLTCFAYALPQFMGFALLEQSEEPPLPNRELYDVLSTIDQNWLLGQLAIAEPKIRAIRRHLGSGPYVFINVPTAPTTFWWRHWKEHQASPSSRRSL